MLRSLYSGISGMKVNQTKMDVIGNNIANVGTTAFKGSRARFQDMLSQVVSDSMAPAVNQGGKNASQVGLGVQMAGIDTIVSQGMMQPTERNLDVAIDGDGYLMVGKGPTIFKDGAINIDQSVGHHNIDQSSLTKSGMSVMYTRDGSLTLDSDGNLLTSDGYRVMGYSLTNESNTKNGTGSTAPAIPYGGFNFQFTPGTSLANTTLKITSTQGAQLGVTGTLATGLTITGDFTKEGNISAKDLQTSLNTYLKSLNSDQTAIVSGTSAMVKTGTSLPVTSSINVSVGGFNFSTTPGEALNGYKFTIVPQAANTALSVAVDTDKKEITINGDFTANGLINASDLETEINKALNGAGFQQSVNVVGTSATVTSAVSSAALSGGTPVQSVGEDGVINFVDGTRILNAYDGNLKSLRIPDKVHDNETNQDLRIRSFSIDKDGIINGVLEDGRVAALGQIAMSSFKNPAGLNKLGKNLYSQSVNSGTETLKSGLGTIGEDNSKGYGDMLQGMLEMSNVDLAEQFTDMIVTSRAFQASGKMISTGDEILQDIINLKR